MRIGLIRAAFTGPSSSLHAPPRAESQDLCVDCGALRQVVAGSAEAGCQEMSRILELGLATLLACAQAAQGYPLEEWSYRSAAGGAVAPGAHPPTHTRNLAQEMTLKSHAIDSGSGVRLVKALCFPQIHMRSQSIACGF